MGVGVGGGYLFCSVFERAVHIAAGFTEFEARGGISLLRILFPECGSLNFQYRFFFKKNFGVCVSFSELRM